MKHEKSELTQEQNKKSAPVYGALKMRKIPLLRFPLYKGGFLFAYYYLINLIIRTDSINHF